MVNKTLAIEDVAQIIVENEPTKRQKSESDVLINQIVKGKSIDLLHGAFAANNLQSLNYLFRRLGQPSHTI